MQKKVILTLAVLLLFVSMVMPVLADDGRDRQGCAPAIANIAGNWLMKATYIHDCAGYPDSLPPIPVTIEQTGNLVTITSAIYNFTTPLCGDTFTWQGSYPDTGGTTTVEYFWMKVSADGKSMSGMDAWHWTYGDYTCTGSDWTIGTKQ